MPKTILVVEDEIDIRDSIISVLEFENFDTIEADDGHQAVELAQNCLPDVIICDIRLPKLDGYGVIQKLRQHPLTANIPLIFLTALTNEEDVKRGLTLGATSYITKPFNTNMLFAAINESLTHS